MSANQSYRNQFGGLFNAIGRTAEAELATCPTCGRRVLWRNLLLGTRVTAVYNGQESHGDVGCIHCQREEV
jgi:hypothetical protein